MASQSEIAQLNDLRVFASETPARRLAATPALRLACVRKEGRI